MKTLFKILAIVITFAAVYLLPPTVYILTHRDQPDPDDIWVIVSFIAALAVAAFVGYRLFRKPNK